MSVDRSLRVRPDKVASVCHPFSFGPYVRVSSTVECREGTAIVCQVVTARDDYGSIELVSGRQSKLVPGDTIVGILANRAALRGFAGRVPQSLSTGDEVHLLNMGGVVGSSEGPTIGLGAPITLKVIGTPLLGDKPARIADFALPTPPSPPPAKVVGIVGTCMNAGKSTAAAVLIRSLRARGLRIHAGKATGVGAIRDVLAFADNGASVSLSFIDCGFASTAYRKDVPKIYKDLVALLAEEGPDAIVLELGDGLMGDYGVDEILDSGPGFVTCVVAANDMVGAWAAVQRLRSLQIGVACVSGPATDNIAAIQKFQNLGVNAANAHREPSDLVDFVAQGAGL